MSRLVLVLAVVLAMAVAGGCAGSEEAADTTTTDASTVTQTATDPLTTTTTEKLSPTAWTEFGATVDDWNAAHEPDEKYAVDMCCHLPGPLSAGARYGALLIDEFDGTPRVWGFSIFWDDATSLAEAEKVVKQAAPPGAKLTSRVVEDGCVMIAYRSAALSRALYKNAVMHAALYSRGDQSFNGSVNDISFLSAPPGSVGC